MKTWSIELRKKVVEAYKSGRTGSYEETAKIFGIGVASVSRWLRKYRETGDVAPCCRKGNNPRKVDLEWLNAHAEKYPDARIIDRVEAWAEHSGIQVRIETMRQSLHSIGWSFKKNADGKGAWTPRGEDETEGVSEKTTTP